ncbi:protein SMAX1-LIKE 3 isoform X2 [Elaeis guineensis]|uniref:Protein SMAX1-LIKE 3 isoform X2 n=1 Tax=Elaeis guineensis var. tenera TaxID=51953 RepID=A0A8N4EXE0_ELAGV|nr:protein SMAX1-LIKE 3 isoform X2 [Elaeis guineensis]
MRAGGCMVQQALTPEAATIVKQAVNLARQRGHAQVTPLHVATTMLSSPTGLLRSACLQSHSHPLQCKALELCFNVSLNRLPTSPTSGPLLGPYQAHHHLPSFSNALLAAFKRAQAHQRRGSMENQQQPLLAAKIELEQLIISILDDPSVSRVMREAGFLSTHVKNNVEKTLSVEICAPNPNPNLSPPKEGSSLLTPTQVIKTKPLDQEESEDVMSVMETLMRGKNVVVVGEFLATSESVVIGLMDRIEKEEFPNDALRSIKILTLPLYSFSHMSREEVEQKIGELRCLLKGSCGGKRTVLYLGDLKWAANYGSSRAEKVRGLYCPLDHIIMELGSLVCDGIEGQSGILKFGLMGIATAQTYMECRVGQASLQDIWDLQPITVAARSLELSLNYGGGPQSQCENKRSGIETCWCLPEGIRSQLACCADCSIKFEIEARDLQSIVSDTDGLIPSGLPSWLRQYKEENKRATSNDQLKDLCKKWNSICNAAQKCQHHQSEKTLKFSSASPNFSISPYDQPHSSMHQIPHAWPITINIDNSWREHHFCMSNKDSQEQEGQRLSHDIGSNSNMASSSDSMEIEYHCKFKELNAENLKNLCSALEEKVPWQKDIIPEIASTILQCRSGMIRRKEKTRLSRIKEETWLFFEGGDVEGKDKIARELASLVYGSYNNFLSIGVSTFSSPRSDSTDDLRNKRSRSEATDNYLKTFIEAIHDNPHRVIIMEDIDEVDYHSQLGIGTAIERGRVQNCKGEEISISDAIIIFSCESINSQARSCSPATKQKLNGLEEEEEADDKYTSANVSLDLNLCSVDNHEDRSFDGLGLVESVDRMFFFKLPEEL